MNSIKRDLKDKSRRECINRWISGRGIEPSDEELNAFKTGFNMAWKHKPTKHYIERDSLVSEIVNARRIQ